MWPISKKMRAVLVVTIVIGILLAIYPASAQSGTEDEGFDLVEWGGKLFKRSPTGKLVSYFAGNSPCNILWSSSWGNCAAYIWAIILNFVLKIFSYFLWATGKIFNIVVYINNTSFYNQALVNVGWKITRDVVNIFYIFILLIIAIATILRIGGYGMKDLLFQLIISALLVNFSLPLTGLVIDATNVLGAQFYMSAATAKDESMAGIPDGDTGIKKLDISSALIQGFEPERIYQTAETSSGIIEASADLADRLLNISIAYMAGILLIAVAVFTLLAAGALLVIRIVVLWFVMILSPFAFASFVLPGTRGIIWNKWWNALFSQAFFYPAYMFMLYLSIKAINSGVIADLVGASKDQLPQMFADTSMTASLANFGASVLAQKVNLILSFFMMGAFMIGGLIIAKQMGAYGASAAQKFAGGTMKMVGGAIGRPIGRVGRRYVSRFASEAEEGGKKLEARRWYSPTGLALRTANLAQKIPVVGGAAREGLQKASLLSKNAIKEHEKKMDGHTDDQLQRLVQDPHTQKDRRLAAMSKLIDRKNLRKGSAEKGTAGYNEEVMGSQITELRNAGMVAEAAAAERLRPDIALGRLRKENLPWNELRDEFDKITKRISPDDIEKMDESVFEGGQGEAEAVVASMMRTMSSGKLLKIADRPGKIKDAFQKEFDARGGAMNKDGKYYAEDIAKNLEKDDYPEMAKFVRGSIGAQAFGFARRADEKEGEKPPTSGGTSGGAGTGPLIPARTVEELAEIGRRAKAGGQSQAQPSAPVVPTSPSGVAGKPIDQALDNADRTATHDRAVPSGAAPQVTVKVESPAEKPPIGAGDIEILRSIRKATQETAAGIQSGIVVPDTKSSAAENPPPAPEPPKGLDNKK